MKVRYGRIRAPWRIIIQGYLKGLSPLRILNQVYFSNLTLEGRVIEIGAKSRDKSAYALCDSTAVSHCLLTDISATNEVEQLDIAGELPGQLCGKFDHVICSHVLEHIFDFKTASNNLISLLGRNGRLTLTVPFLHRVHGDPSDFFRYTEYMFAESFKKYNCTLTIIPCGIGPFTDNLARLNKIIFGWNNFIYMLMNIPPLFFDWCAEQVGLRKLEKYKKLYPLGYVVLVELSD